MDTHQSIDADHLELRPTPPFDFASSLAFVDRFAPCAADRHCQDETLVTGGFAGEHPFVATVRTRETWAEGGADVLAATIDWPVGRGDPDAVGEKLRASFSLDDDLQPLYGVAADDPPFESVVATLHGYHHVRFPTPFEAACWAALSQRTPWSLATRQKQALVDAAGYVAEVDGETIVCFPTPAGVLGHRSGVEAAIDHERKVRTILEAARAFDGEPLAALPDDALRERLQEVWGFGPWSSEFVALRGFGRMSRLPRTERRLGEAVARLYELDEPAASDEDLDRLSAPYAPQRGYWAHYVRVWAEWTGTERRSTTREFH